MKEPRANSYRTSWAGDLRADHVGSDVRVAGWVHRRRDHGGLIFIDLRDRSGLLQLVFHPEEATEAHAAAHSLRSEDVISVSGELAARAPDVVNPKLATGEVELRVRELHKLADSETPPFQVDEDLPVEEGLRLKYRYLDLRRESMQRSIELRHEVAQAMRTCLHGLDFLEIETPILTRATSSSPAVCSRGPGTRCRSRRSSSSSCSWSRDSSATTRSSAAFGTRTCGPTGSPSSHSSTWRCRSLRKRTCSKSPRTRLPPPQTIILLPVHTAACAARADGALVVLVAIQLLVLGLYLPPVLKALPSSSRPPQTIISPPVHTVV